MEQTGTIIAGTGSQERSFTAPRSALERSSVIKGWIERRETIPPSLQKGDALYFPACDPEVVRVTVEFLKSTTPGILAMVEPSPASSETAVMFYIKLYKFALCLSLRDLCTASLRQIDKMTYKTSTFIKILSVSTSDKTRLVDDQQFRTWIMKNMSQRYDVLKDSALFKNTITQDGELAWQLCSLLLSSINEDGIKGPNTNNEKNAGARGMLTPPRSYTPSPHPTTPKRFGA